MMAGFEYDITRHSADDFTQLVYFCNEKGECDIDNVPTDQLTSFKAILDERGLLGWELVQIVFGEGGIVAFWKRAI